MYKKLLIVLSFIALNTAVMATAVDPLLERLATIEQAETLEFVREIKRAIQYQDINKDNCTEVYVMVRDMWLFSDLAMIDELFHELEAYMEKHELEEYNRAVYIEKTHYNMLKN